MERLNKFENGALQSNLKMKCLQYMEEDDPIDFKAATALKLKMMILSAATALKIKMMIDEMMIVFAATYGRTHVRR